MKSQKKDVSTLLRLVDAPGWAFLLSLLLIAAFSYSNTLFSPLVLDDFNTFVTDQHLYVKDFSFDSLKQLASTRFGKRRLLPLLTFAADHKIGRGRISQYHSTNISIHLLAVIALFFFSQGLLATQRGRRALSGLNPKHFCLLVTAFWALNPVQTNAVTYLVQRMTSLTALFYVTALACYIYWRLDSSRLKRLLFFTGFLLAALCAFLSKENSATLPFAVFLVECMFITPGLGGRILKKMRWYHWVGMALLILVILPLGESTWDEILAPYGTRHFTLMERLLTETRVLVFYISLLLVPLPGRMNLEHDFTLSTSLFSPPTTFLSIIFLAVLIWTAAATWKRAPLISFGIWWFFLNLIIESTVVPLELAFEHRLYLPSIGLFIALVGCGDILAKHVQKRFLEGEFTKICFLGVVILCSFLSVMTTLRNNDWRDPIALHADSARKSPNKPRALSNYGLALARSGRHEEGIEVLKKAIALGRPHYEEYLTSANNILVSLVMLKKYDEAIEWGEKFLIELTPDIKGNSDVSFMGNLAVAYMREGLYIESLEANKTSVSIGRDPTPVLFRRLYQLFANVYDDKDVGVALALGVDLDVDKEEAIANRIIFFLLDMKRYELAKQYIEIAMARQQENGKVQDLLARYQRETELNRLQAEKADILNSAAYKTNISYRLYLSLADFILNHYSPLNFSIGWLYAKALEEGPNDPFIYLRIAQWHLTMHRYDLACEIAEQAAKDFPDFVPLLEIMLSAYVRNNDLEKANATYARIMNLSPGYRRWYYFQGRIAKLRRARDKEKEEAKVQSGVQGAAAIVF
jgi:tetratricopeptide (TPR) repeat protein